MKKATKILSEEHEYILMAIDAMEKECSVLEKGKKKIDKIFFENAIDFIRNYADKFHHAKEEDILFKELNKNASKMHCNPVEQMLREHDFGRAFVKKLGEGVKKGNKRDVVEGAKGYSQLLRDHIFKEDNILYPMADQALSAKAQKDILKKFAEAEEKKLKKDAGKKYENMAKEFVKRATFQKRSS